MTTLLQATGAAKQFPNGTRALKGVDLAVQQGSVHGLVGANGAGKSTLIKCLGGVQNLAEGTITWDGQPVSWRNPGHAQQAGLATIHQHVPLVPTLSVLENVFLSRSGPWRTTAAMLAEFEALVERLGYPIDPHATVGALPIGRRQMVAILQALAIGARLVIMDEPTASLSETERRIVLQVVRRLADAGTTFVYISHFLDEILDVTDEISVLRDGRIVLSEATSTVTAERLVQAIAGRELLAVERATSKASIGRADVLTVTNLSSPVGVRNVSFSVAEGEVVGLAGLLGSGRSEILNAIFGADAHARGEVRVRGRRVRLSPRHMVRAGMAYVPEDRLAQGLHPEQPLWKNISLTDLDRLSWGRSLPQETRERERAAQAISDLGIVASGVDALPRELSGGNAQKVVFAKWLYADKDVWLLDEPTAGIDVGAKADLLSLVNRLSEEGRGVVVACSDFEELLSVASRILVIRGGQIIADVGADDTSEEELLTLAHGLGSTTRRKAHA